MLEWRLGLRHHRRWLIDLGYALLHTGSNSAPHRFRAHRLQALLTGYLRAGVDAQLYWTVQRRRYEQKTEFLPLRSADEYA
jgi:hypothetical protein